MTDFNDFGLREPILKALVTEGYTEPTPIQIQAIPNVLAGRDLCGIAQTGTGKTAAFALPILHKLAGVSNGRKPRACRTLVLSPTRELASQIAESFRTYGQRLDLKTTVIFGGVSQGRQAQEMARGVDILVATPGRLLDLIEQRLLTLAHVEVLVVDEADQMLDLGFIVPLRRIVKMLPAERQTLFFSATMPKTIAKLADEILTDPVQVAVAPVATTVERVKQNVMFVSGGHKQALLDDMFADPALERVLVFTRTKHGADKVVRNLGRAGVESAAIHGNKSQAQRERALAAFRAGKVRALVATDIAARGIHVENVSHVINFELPNIPESYVHRIGRTARAGAEGIAISFCNGEERPFLKDIEKLTRQQIPVLPLPAGLAQRAEASRSAEAEAPRPDRRPQRRANPAAAQRGPKRPQGEQARGPKRQSEPGRGQGQKRRFGKGGNGGKGSGAGRSDMPAFLQRPAHG